MSHVHVEMIERYKGYVNGEWWGGWIIRDSDTKLWYAEDDDGELIKSNLASRGCALSAVTKFNHTTAETVVWDEEYKYNV